MDPIELRKSGELNKILKRAHQIARENAKNAGTSIYYEWRNMWIRENANGNKFEIRADQNGNRYEVKIDE